MKRSTFRVAAAALLSLLMLTFSPTVADAQFFSPGKLARAHADLEGLSNCLECHGAGDRVSKDACLACHKTLASRVVKRVGYHAHSSVRDQACEHCHRDHQGRSYKMIRWGKGGMRAFDHKLTGWPTAGAHRKLDCRKCHVARRITAKKVLSSLKERRLTRTFFGLPTRCRDCHFDEHRGQLGLDCADCHDERAWSPAPDFSHAKTQFRLRGRHKKVECADCHPAQEADPDEMNRFPKPRADRFATFSGVAHERCTDCHEDPHVGRFGARCEQCHSEKGWRRIKATAKRNRGFHDKTRYPLEGAHRDVDCKACHRQGVRYRGLPFARCTDCHADAHDAQLSPPDCERCHDVRGFSPARYGQTEHARARFTLDGAHAVVGCGECHPTPKPATRPGPRRRKRKKSRFKRKALTSRIRLKRPDIQGRCAECHADPHGGQLIARIEQDGCEGCHDVSSFTEVRFDHATDTRFALEGAHTKVRCADCHPTPDGASTVYRPRPTDCAGCHADPHVGQLDEQCDRCHGSDTFETHRFSHDDAALTDIQLDGRHRKIDCDKCHLKIEVPDLGPVVRFKGTPRRCDSCHADPHRGVMRPYAPVKGAPDATDCSRCHATGGWSARGFDHAQTGYPLSGPHQQAACGRCHAGGRFDAAPPTACADCHRDVHAGRLGRRCESCHSGERDWSSRFDAFAHERTLFPLTGRHGVLPCETCHIDRFQRGFSRAPLSCAECHQAEYQLTASGSIDHVAAGFDQQCQGCHTSWTFKRATFPGHEQCFQISRGDHAGIRCADCHRSVQGIASSSAGRCDTGNATCTSCHEHRCEETDSEHREVPGYQCKDNKCYECHSFTPGR